MRTQRHPYGAAAAAASLGDVPDDLPDCDGLGACFASGGGGGFPFPAQGLCCPDDPLDLVLHLFPPAAAAPAPPPPAAAVPPPSTLGIGATGGQEPPRQDQEQERPQQLQERPQPLTEADCGGGGWWEWDSSSWGLSTSDVLDELDDFNMFFADGDAPDCGGGGAEAEANFPSCEPSEACKPPLAHTTAGGGGPVPVHTRGGGGAVPNNDASSPVPAGGALQPYDAFDGGAVSSDDANAPPLLALKPAAADAAPAAVPPAAAAVPGLHACGAFASPGGGIVSHGAPPPLMAPMPLLPARAALPVHASTALLAAGGVYSTSSAPPSATPSPPSGASSGSGSGRGWPPSSAESEADQFPAAPACVVPRKQRSLPSINRRRIKRPWLLNFPLHALPPVIVAIAPPPPPPSTTHPVVAASSSSDKHYMNFDDDDDGAKKNRSAAALAMVPFAAAAAPPPPLPPPPGRKNTAAAGDDDDDDYTATATATAGGGGGGGFRKRRRLMAPRQRNRKAERVCSHCGSPETPQWRAGPGGPGTLCNACGIRYAANRLLPEYRPSTAPSFRSGEHSNRHRKVMKLREHTTGTVMEEEGKEKEKPSSVVVKKKLRGQVTARMTMMEEEKPSSVMKLREQMTVARTEEKPPERQTTAVEDGREEEKEDDDGFMSPGVCTYISSAAGL